MPKTRALVIDDDALIGRVVAKLLSRLGVEAETAPGGEAALARLAESDFQLVITDMRMPDIDGASLYRQIRQRFGDRLPVVVMTSHGSIDLAVTLLQEGVADFIEKPIAETTFLPRIERVLEAAALKAKVHGLEIELRGFRELHSSKQILGESRAIQSIVKQLSTLARSDAAVLLTGESGTGKELFARAIHDLSERSQRPFITVNCGALPEELLESELFGHVKGAFTDARVDKIGLSVEADGGTLFLDEIGEISLKVQVKLLRFLQEKEVRPVGSNKTRKVDARIVAATNRDLAREVKEGRFREDLYYRINILPIRLPALRQRREDIPVLCDAFLKRFSHEHKKEIAGISPAVMQRLLAHDWPGNIRELENVLRRAVILAAHKTLGPEDVILESPSSAAASDAPLSFQEAKARVVAEFERSYLTSVLAAHHGNISRAADAAGKDRKSFWELLQKYEIDAEEFRRR
jgi:DNA-binding NtrC family response regulator